MGNLTKWNPNLVVDVKSGKIINLKSDKKLQTKDTITPLRKIPLVFDVKSGKKLQTKDTITPSRKITEEEND